MDCCVTGTTHYVTNIVPISTPCAIILLTSAMIMLVSVADPDLQDPYKFPVSGSISKIGRDLNPYR